MNLDELKAKFSDNNQIRFLQGKGNLPMIAVNNQSAKALISLYGGQVLSYQAQSSNTDLLFVSDAAYYQQGKAIKGGIPICWPWFGQDPLNQGRTAHGFARNMMWEVLEISSNNELSATIILALKDTLETQKIWPYAFNLKLTITIAETLKLELETLNKSSDEFTITQALHTYFAVSDIDQVKVSGLDHKNYLDKASIAKRENCVQDGDIFIGQEVDRIYLDVPAELSIEEKDKGRQIAIRTRNNKTAIVWNPWQKIAQEMGDLNNDDYRHFICVETANAADDSINIKPGEKYSLIAEYQMEAMN